MNPTIWTLDIPGWHPTPLNELLGNRHKAGRLKRHDATIIAAAVLAYAVQPADSKRHIDLTLIYPPSQRAVDPDASWKSLFDALVCAKALRNDSKRWVSYDEPTILRGPVKRCIITIQEEV
jgi:hypothetical protein